MPILGGSGVCGVRDFKDLTVFARLWSLDFTLLRWSPLTGTEGSNPSVSAMKIPGKQGFFLLPRPG